MSTRFRIKAILYGALIGAWLGGLYAWFSQAINWVFMPGVPLIPPSGGSLENYLMQYVVTGLIIGAISAIPENRTTGMLLGGLAAAFGMSLIAFSNVWGTPGLAPTVITMLLAFLPLTVLMMPAAFFVRVGVDAQDVPDDQPHLWGRRILVPAVLTLLVLFLGALSLYNARERQAFQYVKQMVAESTSASSQETLPKPLQRALRFHAEAAGTYGLEYSDRVDTFMGPVPVGAELSNFLIIGRYENGYAFACVFTSVTNDPNCADY